MHVFSMAQLIIVTVLAAAFSLPSAAASINREPLGPAGGDQFDVVISPDDAIPSISLAHFAIHRSNDAGQTWKSLQNAEMANGGFLSMTIDPMSLCLCL